METKKEYIQRMRDQWNAKQLTELDVFEALDSIKRNYMIGVIDVEEFTFQSMNVLEVLKRNLF